MKPCHGASDDRVTPMTLQHDNSASQAVAPNQRQATGLISRTRLYLDRRRMNRDLARWFAAARDFKANGLPAGSPAYQQLYQQSCEGISRLSHTWGISRDKIAVEMPGLYSLQKLAHPEPQVARKMPNPFVMFLALALVLCGLAAALGGATGIFHLVEGTIAR